MKSRLFETFDELRALQLVIQETLRERAWWSQDQSPLSRIEVEFLDRVLTREHWKVDVIFGAIALLSFAANDRLMEPTVFDS